MFHCEGKTTIQDYKPRYYGFSFGYDCDIPVKPSLVGLSYNFTISGQSNRTQCLPFPHIPGPIKECTKFYDHISLPNMIGNPDVKSAQESIAGFHQYYPILSYTLSQLPTGGCYKGLKELFCRIFVPECDQVENEVIHICRETCSEILYSCLSYLQNIIYSLYVTKKFMKWKQITETNIVDVIDCNYLPSVNDSVPCYYKPVTCDPPPNVTNAKITSGIVLNGTYLAMSQVEYECLNETFQMEGNSTVTCMYSGKWYKTPKCLKRTNLNPLCIVIPLLIAPLCIFVIIHVSRRNACRRKKTLLLKRNREYDAFVCYNFDEDDGFLMDLILPELEKKPHPPLKMFFHKRDFELGQLITTNINNAINNCNSAIIVMSQGFVNSPICREEFTKCLAENEKDPAFKLFIIMMKEVETLVNVPENMRKEKTYVKKDDPDLFKKIGNHLKLMRQHDMENDNIELDRLIENYDEV